MAVRAQAVDYMRYSSLAPAYEPEAMPETPETGVRSDVREKARERVRVAKQARAKYAVSPFAIVGSLCAAVMLVALLSSYVELNSISAGAAGLQAQIEEESARQAKLQIAYESAFDLDEIESYATGVLGMTPVTSGQTYYLDNSSEDRAEILTQSEDGGLWESVKSFFAGVLEYFK